MSSPRVRKIAERIQVIVAEMLERRVKDPRLGFVTVTDVRLTGDTQQATIFYTVLGGDGDLESTAVALESAKGLLRSDCLLYTSPSPRDKRQSRMPSSA